MVNDFLFELGCEELPSGSVWLLANEFVNQLLGHLDKAQLSYGTVKRFATPRRLAVVIHDLQAQQMSQKNTRRGPAYAAAFDKEGNPSPALFGFAKSCGVSVGQLTKIHTEKGEWMVFDAVQDGANTKDLLPELVTQSLASLPIVKPMRWGAGAYEFARPVHWAVMLYGEEVLKHSLLGVQTARFSRGHRFHHPQELCISSAKSYESQLKRAFVIADFATRRQMIQEQVDQLAQKYQAKAIIPEDLLDEVTSIVEWPQALLGHFEESFLEVPSEALIASMQVHQKCFALHDQNKQLLPYFITVANIESSNSTQVILGNEKVIRARLSDAAFFFHQDKKRPLSEHISATKHVVFQNKLGSLHDKTSRIKLLMDYLSGAFNIPKQVALRAAKLSKCDLMTSMVGEFPELQGLMGYYYALNDAENLAVAVALKEQYMPRFAADALPESDLGIALSLADRIDTLVGIFAIGQKPSGVKDPFKLRRHALAVVRLLISTPLPLNLSTLIEVALAGYANCPSLNSTLVAELKPFILERLHSYYQSLGLSSDLMQAVRARQDEWLYDFDKRLRALQLFVTLPEASSLTAACKRVNNLLNHAGTVGSVDSSSQIPRRPATYSRDPGILIESQTNHTLQVQYGSREQVAGRRTVNCQQTLDSTAEINENILEQGTEQQLFTLINQMTQTVDSLYQTADYGTLLKQLASLKAPIDNFFDHVMVLTEDENLRKNRLILLARLQNLLQGVADISMLQLS